MKLEEHKDLWARIRGFPIDDPDAAIKFSDKLAFENNWSAGFTRRAITEYRRFIFLCCISPAGASPSEVVDEVWHLHLTYTRNYWNEFCRQTIGKEIHHHPSGGGATEKGRHQNWYTETIELYHDVFGKNPPIDIWPDPQNAPAKFSKYYLPEINYKLAYEKHFYILALPFLYPLFFGKIHPFALTGPQFLGFFPLLFASVLIILRIGYLRKKKMIESVVDETYEGDATSFQLARFIYGSEKAKQTAIVDLASKRIVTANSWGSLNIYPSLYRSERDANNPMSSFVRENYEDGQYIDLKELSSYYNDSSTFHQGLSNLYKVTGKKDRFLTLLILMPIVVGVVRLIQGMSNEKPVGYLAIMCIGAAVILIGLGQELSRKNILQNIFKNRFEQRELAYMDRELIPAQFVFLGLASLAGVFAITSLSKVFRDSMRNTASSSGSWSGSGCGNSCGGSCGGGGGGGCGGCGGGD